MSRPYGYDADGLAYDEGYRATWRSNPHDPYGDHEEERLRRAWDQGYDDRRREREREEERKREQAELEEHDRRVAEERAYEDAMWEQPEPPSDPGPEPEEPGP